MNIAFKNYQKKLEGQLRDKSKTDFKSFWKILNKMSATNRNSKSLENIDIDRFYEYFKNLNSNPNVDEDAEEDFIIGDQSLEFLMKFLTVLLLKRK